ncbi:MAG: choice-of-anchor tandem repeat GloVer-containing protein [Terriglobales bacterium]
MRPKRFAQAISWSALLLGLCLTVMPQAMAGVRYKTLHVFTGRRDGGLPAFNLALDSTGNLYGVTSAGGPECKSKNYCGTVFQLMQLTDGKWEEKVLHGFTKWGDGDGPNGGPAIDAKGNLYGAATAGPGGIAALYQMAPEAGGWSYKLIYGHGAGLTVLFDKADNIYGYLGPGTYGSGAVSELIHKSKGWAPKTLYSFCNPYSCPDGDGPLAPPSWDGAGNLYGTTYFGGNGPPNCPGSLGCGVAFQMTPNSDGSWTYHVLHRFANFKTDGQYPYGGLTVDSKGNVYGTTTEGGKFGNGTVFELTPTSGGHWKQTVLYDFPNIYLGGAPWANLLFDKAGNLYGTAGGGNLSCPQTCGVIFKLAPQAGGNWKYSLVHKFNGTDGDSPNGLTMDGAGNLYGTTEYGGEYNYGGAFKLMP